MQAHGGAIFAGGHPGGPYPPPVGFGFWPFFPSWGFGWMSQYHPCARCGAQVPRAARYCPWCRAPQTGAMVAAGPCPRCSGDTVAGAPFCPQCGAELPPTECGTCHAPLSPQAKFCAECGNAVSRASTPPPAGGAAATTS